ncbi:MAG TPA: alpha/beta fold hydrolase [Alphaproteobacteria bacterium]
MQSPVRPPRPGPRPLPLHITTAATTWLSSAAALPLLKRASPNSTAPTPTAPELSVLASSTMWAWLAKVPWHKTVQERADALQRDLAAVDPDAFAAAVGREVRRRLDELATGLTLYRRHPYRRTLVEAPRLWRDGTTTLRNYAAITGAPEDGAPLLIVPSLINRAYVLDLTAERSFMRFLGAQGFQPFLIDWGRPGLRERQFGLSDYILGRLGTALDRIIERTGKKPALIGYCMGGNLALGLAAARPRDVAALALLATPWDFHAERADLAHATAHAMTPWMPIIDQLGAMPVDVLQMLFFALDPFLSARKFRAFAGAAADSPKAREFVALEDWLNDGVPLAARVARECLLGWYGENQPARGEWRLGGRAVRPEKIDVPSLVVIPEQDRIVPPASAEALARVLPKVTKLSPPLGHIGMMVGGKAADAVWQPLARWLDSAIGQRL